MVKPCFPSNPLRYPQVYIAGSYSAEAQHSVQTNVYRALDAARRIIAYHPVLPIVPHTMGPHHGTTWEQAMTRCRGIIAGLDPARDAVVMIPGWQASRGATEERELALSLGIRVYELAEVVR